MKDLWKQREDKIEKAGGGAWHRKADGKMIEVDVTFYPKTKLWIEDPTRRQITIQELERDYARLQV